MWAIVRMIAAPALAALLCPPWIALGQSPGGSGRNSTVIDGRSFAGINLPSRPERGEISLAAARSWTWSEDSTNRLLLDRHVRVKIGTYEFTAQRAVLWIEPVTIGGEKADQVAIYFEEVTTGAGDGAGFRDEADQLLVTGIIINDGATLRADLPHPAGRPNDPVVQRGEARLARFLAGLPSAQALARRPVAPSDPRADSRAWIPPDDRPELPPAQRAPVEFPQDGLLSFSLGEQTTITQLPDEGLWAVTITGGVDIQYDRVAQAGLVGGGGRSRTVQLSAQRVVVFLDDNVQPGQSRYQAQEVRGMYLEGDVVVATDDHTLRGSSIYYAPLSEQAIIVDAIFWTYDEMRGMPLYLRADQLRQESENQWSAGDVVLANIGFAEPHLSLGARTVTITRIPADPQSGEGARAYVDAEGVTARLGSMPVFGWPHVRGDFRSTPLREVSVGSRSGDPIVRTTWDLYTLLGLDPAPGNSANLLLDGYFNRGPAVGAELEWETADINGSLFSYYIYDDGEDRLPSGATIDQDNEHRGLVLADQVWRLNEDWTLFFEGAYASDETFVPAFFRDVGETRREFANSFYARYVDERTAFTLEARGTFNDFVVNEYLLQSLGYQTQSTPDIAYRRFNDPLFAGLLSYSSEYRYSRLSLAFTEPTMAELGFEKPKESQPVFGIDPDQSIGDTLRAAGLDEDTVNRLDTRHEIEMPLQAGALSIVPFAVGRVTYYDTEFNDYTSALGQSDENDQLRTWGSVGLRLTTTIQKVDKSVRSKFFDLHQIRHIIEPSATLWTADTNVEQESLPIYDEEVESLATGTAIRLGLRNVWQTKRGGERNERVVDWLVIDTEYVWSSSNVDVESPIGRFFGSRPERSNLGRFVNNDIVLQLTDALAVTNNILVDYDRRQLMRATVGGVLDHGAGFSSFLEYRYLREPDGEFFDLGVAYELTRKYAAETVVTYDSRENELHEISAIIARRFPQLTMEIGVDYDNIANEVSLALALRPVGLGRESRSRVYTRDLFDRNVQQPQPLDVERLQGGPFGSE